MTEQPIPPHDPAEGTRNAADGRHGAAAGPSDGTGGPSGTEKPSGNADETPGTSAGPPGTADEALGANAEPPGTAEEAPGTNAEPAGPTESLRALRRSRDERMLAGVLGGLAERLGIDPVLLRIATVVLTVFGGVGIVIYAAGWLLIPDEEAERSIAEQALGRGDDRPEPATMWLAGGLMLAVLFAAGATFSSGVGTVLIVLAAAGVIVMLRRDGEVPAGRFADHTPDDALSDGTAGAAAPGPAAGGGAGDHSGPLAATEESQRIDAPHVADAPGHGDDRPEFVHSFTAPTQPVSAWPDPPDWPGSGFEAPEPPGPPHQAEKPARSHLGNLTLSAVAVALGILAINDAVFAVVPASAYVALALAIIGAGLLIGTWYGRSRGLIAWGLIGTLVALPVAAIGDFLDWDLSGGDRTVTINDVAELPGEPRSHGTGRVVYDMGDLDPAEADRLSLDVSQTMGQLQIIVPPEVDVTVHASTGMGHIVAFEEQAGGHQDITVTDAGPDGAGGGELTLDLALDLGEIVVERAGTPDRQGVAR